MVTTGAACLGLLMTAGGVAAAAPGSGSAASTACTVKIGSFVLNPVAVHPGQSTTATLTARNCTAKRQTVSETWYAFWSGPTGGIPSGCPIYDPFLRFDTLAAYGRLTSTTGYSVPAACTATQLAITVTIADSTTGTVLDRRTADLAIA